MNDQLYCKRHSKYYKDDESCPVCDGSIEVDETVEIIKQYFSALGKKCLTTMSKEQRSKRASKASNVRWEKFRLTNLNKYEPTKK